MAITIRAIPLIMAPKSSIAASAITAALAALLAVIAVPSLIAALITAPSDADLERVRRGVKPPPMLLTQAAHSNIAAAYLFESGRYRANAAAAYFALDPSERQATGIDIEPLVRRSLAADPIQPYGWNRLAYLRLRAGDRDGAYRAWQMSVFTGRYVPGLMHGRISVALSMLPITDRNMVSLLVDQIRLAAAADPNRLALTAYLTNSAPFVRTILWRDTTSLPDFNRYYRWILLKNRQDAKAATANKDNRR